VTESQWSDPDMPGWRVKRRWQDPEAPRRMRQNLDVADERLTEFVVGDASPPDPVVPPAGGRRPVRRRFGSGLRWPARIPLALRQAP
jgi:hypothetical protein